MKKEKAFTLTELLVVVVIIGILSAVVLPKFSKVLETRKTTEAEELMAAVRNEQEARCTLDKNYTGTKADLAVWPKNEGSNYTYALSSTGMSAESKSKKYTLKMQSYREGGICCEGTYCSSLNKNYPSCGAVTNTGSECAAEGVGEEEGPGGESRPKCNLYNYEEQCPTGYTGKIYYTVNADCTGHIENNQCKLKETPKTCDTTTHTEGQTTTETDAKGCTVTTTWHLKDYPTCWTSDTTTTCPEEPEENACTPNSTKLRAPAESCWDGCGEVWDVCATDGTWSGGACYLKSTSECGAPDPSSQAKQTCQTTAGQTTCINWKCVNCKWVKDEPEYQWRSAGTETTSGLIANCAPTINQNNECSLASYWTQNSSLLSDIDTCLQISSPPYASSDKCDSLSCNEKNTGRFCIAGCQTYYKLYNGTSEVGNSRTGKFSSVGTVTKQVFETDWTMYRCQKQ